MSDYTQDRNKTWDELNPEIIKQSKKKYDKKNPIWSFRPNQEIREWLEEERGETEEGKQETNAQLLTRKLTKLMKLEREGL